MADSPDQETRRFAAVRATSEIIGSPTAVVSAKRSPKGSLIGLILILVVIIVVAFVLLFNSLVAPNNSSNPVANPSTSESVKQTGSESPSAPSSAQERTQEQTPGSSTDTPQNRPAHPSLPAGASPANDAAAAATDAGNLNNVYTGSASTSAGFAQAVRDAFVNHYLDTKELSGRVTATSPITGGNYTMNCEDNGEYVTCTGGNNAVVYIS